MRQTLIAIALLCAAMSTAHADDPPWAVGVTADQKASAKRLLEQGNELFLRNKHVEALARYQEAIASWDHPAIRFNIVRTLIALDRSLEANENLVQTLKYGSEPLEEQVYIEALNYQRLLVGRLGTLEVQCGQAGVTLKILAAVVACPASQKITVEPGEQVVISTGAGYQTETQEVLVLPGKTAQIAITLLRVGTVAMEERRRWSTWKPWLVLGAGGGVGIVGLLVNLSSRSERTALNTSVALACPDRCSADEYSQLGFARQESRIRGLSTASVVTIGVGGAATLVGVTLVLLNRPTLHPRRTPTIDVGRDRVTLSLSMQF
jgi:hypothetical protein